MSETFGYARVSTKDQNLDRQLVKFKELGIDADHIYTDKESGKNMDRSDYQRMRPLIRKGDLIYFDSLDRLGRDYDAIKDEWAYLTRTKKADVCILDNEMFDTREFRKMGDLGKMMEDMFLNVLAYAAHLERQKIVRRTSEGIAAARERGSTFGRPRVEADDRFLYWYTEWKATNITATAAWKALGLTKATFYRRVKEYETQLVSV